MLLEPNELSVQRSDSSVLPNGKSGECDKGEAEEENRQWLEKRWARVNLHGWRFLRVERPA